jgi:hypothetical protein
MSAVRPGPVFFALTIVALARPALAANPRAEAAALDAISKAEGDFLAMNYASGAARLDKALRACGVSNCSAGAQAALLRDIGTMEFRAGDKGFATKAFTEALKLQPNIDLNPSYDSPDLRAAWVEVKGGPPAASAPPVATAPGPVAPSPPAYQQPAGDFTHSPVLEQKTDTPLPVYVEGGPGGVAHVIVRFKSSEDSEESEWNHTDLAKMGAGWGGLIPCNAVVAGKLRYYIQGYNKDMDPVATNGDAKTPYQVLVRDDLSGSPPHLPNRPAPKACHQAGKARSEAPAPQEDQGPSKDDCPPGMSGCGKPEKAEGDEEAKADEEGEADTTKGGGRKKKAKGLPHWWIGVAVHIDFVQIPSGPDLCRLHPSGPNIGQPANDKHFYCTDSAGADFPARNATGQVINNELSQGSAGSSNGGIVPGNLRLMASVDYAATGNLLIGVRGGYVLLTYPGSAAVSANYAWGPKVYVEARVTGVIGNDPLKKEGVAPVVFVGGGVSPFDAHTSGTATQCKGSPAICAGMRPTDVPVDMWFTNGPGFVDFGGGVRYAPVPRIAIMGVVRVNLSFGNNGLVPTAGPELGVQYGF